MFDCANFNHNLKKILQNNTSWVWTLCPLLIIPLFLSIHLALLIHLMGLQWPLVHFLAQLILQPANPLIVFFINLIPIHLKSVVWCRIKILLGPPFLNNRTPLFHTWPLYKDWRSLKSQTLPPLMQTWSLRPTIIPKMIEKPCLLIIAKSRTSFTISSSIMVEKNLVAMSLLSLLKIPTTPHHHRYHFGWVTSNGSHSLVSCGYLVTFVMSPFQDIIECDVTPMGCVGLIPGRLCTCHIS